MHTLLSQISTGPSHTQSLANATYSPSPAQGQLLGACLVTSDMGTPCDMQHRAQRIDCRDNPRIVHVPASLDDSFLEQICALRYVPLLQNTVIRAAR